MNLGNGQHSLGRRRRIRTKTTTTTRTTRRRRRRRLCVFFYYKEEDDFELSTETEPIICLLIFSMHCSACPRTLEFIWSFFIWFQEPHIRVWHFKVFGQLRATWCTHYHQVYRSAINFNFIWQKPWQFDSIGDSLHWRDVSCFLSTCPQDSCFRMLASMNVVL